MRQQTARTKSTTSNQRARRKLFQVAMSAVLVGSITTAACAQSGFQLPMLPETPQSVTAPSVELAFPMPPKCNNAKFTSTQAGLALLGVTNRQHVKPEMVILSQAVPMLAAHEVPAAESQCEANRCGTPEVANKPSFPIGAPSVQLTVGIKSGSEPSVTTADAVVPESEANAVATPENTSLTESLIDIDIPLPADVATAPKADSLIGALNYDPATLDAPNASAPMVQPPLLPATPPVLDPATTAPAPTMVSREPEVVKRSAAMQLNIGATENSNSATVRDSSINRAPSVRVGEKLAGSTEYNLSDGAPSKLNAAKPLRVAIEGEPHYKSPAPVQSATQYTPAQRTPVKATLASTAKTVQSKPSLVEAAMPKEASAADLQRIAGEAVNVGLKASTKIEFSQTISNVSVEFPDVCQVLRSGTCDLTLVGLKSGTSRIAIFYTGPEGNPCVEVRQVTIGNEVREEMSLGELASEMTRTLRHMHPQSKVEVVAMSEGLVVQGKAKSEHDAKKIIGWIRHATLVPVKDQLNSN